jgi:hypothetical protein
MKLFRYRYYQEYKNNIIALNEKIQKKELVGIDWSGKKLIYQETGDIFFNEITDEVEKIVDFSLPLFKEVIQKGKEKYDLLDDFLDVECIGIEPIYKSEGYIIIRKDKIFNVYKYKASILIGDDNNKNISISEVCSFKSTLSNNVEQVKMKLIKKYKDLPNPATYFIDIKDDKYTINETVLTIIKKKISFCL